MSSSGLEILARDECLALVRAQSLGRVGVKIGDQLAILPVVYGMLGDDVVFRSDPGTKLMAAVLNTRVVFEVDETDPKTLTGWDVNVVGHAEELLDPDEVARAEALGIRPWAEGTRDRWIRVRAEQVTGRRVPPS